MFNLCCFFFRSVSATALLYVHFKEALRERGTPDRLIDMYHRSIDDESKKRILESFKKPDSCIRCLFATIAFGMGIQIKDIRIVVHWGWQNHVCHIGRKLVGRVAMASSLLQSAMHMAAHSQNK